MTCKICNSSTKSLGSIPFDRNNAEVPVFNNTMMEYRQCTKCNFISCPEMLSWTPEDLGNKVYNDEYIRYDPDYVDIRPTNYAAWISKLFYPYKKFKHLDYGSGQGVMGSKLNSLYGWDSTSYDPYSANTTPSGVFKLITAIEVFEHSLDIDKTIKDIKKYLDPRKGVILFSTQLATKKHDISWWYIGARNGHISISSEESLKILAIRNNMFFSSLNEGVHVLQSSRDNLSSLRRDG